MRLVGLKAATASDVDKRTLAFEYVYIKYSSILLSSNLVQKEKKRKRKRETEYDIRLHHA